MEEVKRERLRREEEERNARRAAAELEQEQQRQMREDFDARVERAVQERERRRQEAMARSPERRQRRAGQLVNDDEVEERLGRDEQEELLGRMAEVENMVQDPNSSVLRDPAALAVVRVPAARLEREDLNEPGPSRSSRQRLKCPVPGYPITRSSQEALDVHTAHRQQP